MTSNERISARTASKAVRRALAITLLGLMAAACAPLTPPDDAGHGASPPHARAAPAPTPAAVPPASPAAPPPAPPPPPPPPILGFDEAVANAAHAVFTNAPAPDAGAGMVVIDPLVDGMTGYQSKATQSIQERITGIVKTDFPKYAVRRITPDSLKQQPRVLVGTFTPVNAQMKTTGEREAYRFCLVMADLKTGKIVAKSVARARIADADSTPTAAFGDSPVWTDDPNVQDYVATCLPRKVGAPLGPEYLGDAFS